MMDDNNDNVYRGQPLHDIRPLTRLRLLNTTSNLQNLFNHFKRRPIFCNSLISTTTFRLGIVSLRDPTEGVYN